MARTRFVVLGGFLGAGKTTTIARLAQAYLRQGKQVAIVTNDQAADLVDTQNLRAQGFDVSEVAGACFCCRFDELTRAVEQLAAKCQPDIILTEPVGSCADLVATVIHPLRKLCGETYDVAPYGVIIKPAHGRKILSNERHGGFSPKAAYIFRKQLEEADYVILNRIDQLTPAEVEELAGLVQQHFPEMPVVRLSALTGEGLDDLLHKLAQEELPGQRVLDIDYDVYAEGEAELGWLNTRFQLNASELFPLDELLVAVVRQLGQLLAARNAEAAHVKMMGQWNGFHAVANLVSRDTPVELSRASGCRTRSADLIVNARVAVAPDVLQQLTEQAVTDTCRQWQAEARQLDTHSLRPGRPVPTYRIAGLKGEG